MNFLLVPDSCIVVCVPVCGRCVSTLAALGCLVFPVTSASCCLTYCQLAGSAVWADVLPSEGASSSELSSSCRALQCMGWPRAWSVVLFVQSPCSLLMLGLLPSPGLPVTGPRAQRSLVALASVSQLRLCLWKQEGHVCWDVYSWAVCSPSHVLSTFVQREKSAPQHSAKASERRLLRDEFPFHTWLFGYCLLIQLW